MFVIGYKTPNLKETGTLLYHGDDADAANKAHLDNADKFPRIAKSLAGIEAFFLTVQHFDPEHPVAKAETEAAKKAEASTVKKEEAAEQKTLSHLSEEEHKPKKSKK